MRATASRATCAALLLCQTVVAAAPATAQLTIRVTGVPAATPPGATIYVAGNFDGWNPAAPGYALSRGADGVWSITLPDSVRGPIEFKFTRGSWATVETTASGGDVPNRTFTVPTGAPSSVDVSIAGWAPEGPRAPVAHTASRDVSVVTDSFSIPQLGRTRRVWVYLPPGYATSTRRYPVIYMHDGQNVFDAATSFAGEWGVDETLDSLAARGDRGAIVIAVDHGGEHRLDEYDPWKATNPKYGGGEGAAYVRFLVQTLKPWVDAHYRTRTDRANTAIIGSSMGGLISLYAALTYPNVFGKAGIFSCACWIARDSVYALARRSHAGKHAPRLYFAVGGQETADNEPVHDQDAIVAMLRANAFGERQLSAHVVADGKHAEWFWRREFPAAYQWLMTDAANSRPSASRH